MTDKKVEPESKDVAIAVDEIRTRMNKAGELLGFFRVSRNEMWLKAARELVAGLEDEIGKMK